MAQEWRRSHASISHSDDAHACFWKGWRDMAMFDAPERAALGGRGRWLQLGLVAATAAAPLIARWQSLRESDRAQELRERAGALRARAADRLSDATHTAQALQQTLRQSLRQAPPATDLDRADREAALSQLAQLAATIPDVEGARHRRLRATFWLAGVSAGLLAAGAITYVVIRNRTLARAEDDALVELSLDHLDQGPQTAPAPGEQPVTEAPESLEPDFATPPEFSDEDEEGALWVGDITTQTYMPLGARRNGTVMPEPARRIYFATESQALAAGYHRAGGPASGHE